MKRLNILILALILLLPSLAGAESQGKLAPWELMLIDSVAEFEALTYDQHALLYAIRCHEFGEPGIECGIELPMAKVYKEPMFSELLQLRYTARIIKQRYYGDVYDFGLSFHNSQAKTKLGRWEAQRHWASMVRKYIREFEKNNPKVLK